jgi:hypothetical protein
MVRQIYGITVQKIDVAQWVDELASCPVIQIYGCATRGTERPWAI